MYRSMQGCGRGWLRVRWQARCCSRSCVEEAQSSFAEVGRRHHIQIQAEEWMPAGFRRRWVQEGMGSEVSGTVPELEPVHRVD